MQVPSELCHVFLKVNYSLVERFHLFYSQLALHQVQSVEFADTVVLLGEFLQKLRILLLDLR